MTTLKPQLLVTRNIIKIETSNFLVNDTEKTFRSRDYDKKNVMSSIGFFLFLGSLSCATCRRWHKYEYRDLSMRIFSDLRGQGEFYFGDCNFILFGVPGVCLTCRWEPFQIRGVRYQRLCLVYNSLNWHTCLNWHTSNSPSK